MKRFDVKKTARIPAASGVPTLSKADEPRNPEEKEEMKKFPYREAVTATITRSDIAYAVRAVGSDEDLPVSSSHERMGGYVRWTGLWTLHGSVYGLGCRSLSGHKTIGFGCSVDAGEGSDQLALKDARSDSIGYLGGRVRLPYQR